MRLQIALTQVGSHSFEGDAEVVLVVPQCQLGVPVGVGYWFPLFQWSQEGVIDAPVAEGGCWMKMVWLGFFRERKRAA